MNTSFTYVSTGVIDSIEDNAGAGPTVVGHKITSHLSVVKDGLEGWRIFSVEKTSSKEC